MTGKCIVASSLAAALAGLLVGCSEYTDRRDTIALSGGDAVATDKVIQMVDPWPVYSGNHSIAFNGQKMQSAVQRYRNNQVIPPVGTGTSGTYQQQSAASNPTGPDPTATQPAAPKSP